MRRFQLILVRCHGRQSRPLCKTQVTMMMVKRLWHLNGVHLFSAQIWGNLKKEKKKATLSLKTCTSGLKLFFQICWYGTSQWTKSSNLKILLSYPIIIHRPYLHHLKWQTHYRISLPELRRLWKKSLSLKVISFQLRNLKVPRTDIMKEKQRKKAQITRGWLIHCLA